VGTDHTLRHLRSGEHVYFDLFDRTACRASPQDIYHRAAERRRSLIEAHRDPVPARIKARLDAYARQYA